jgi:hypothetical protein
VFYARTLMKNGKPEEAEKILREGMWNGLPKGFIDAYIHAMVEALTQQGKEDRVLTILREPVEGDLSNAAYLETLGFTNTSQGSLSDKRNGSIREANKEPTSWLSFYARSVLGESLLKLRRYNEAEPLLVSGTHGLEQNLEEIPMHMRQDAMKESLGWVVRLYEEWEKPDQAAEWKQKLAVLE